ncbi:MAG: alpha/beta hydrolase [Candidatus Heimdallarchaeota archaeon]|nr:MAG: alpha/beta hydrolase [Candidatus Heimdallarchaeota archaeon]
MTRIDFEYYSPIKPDFPNLIFIHGAGGDKTQWEKQKIFFQPYGWGIIVLSLPSHGQSSPSESLNLDEYVNTIHEMIINQNLENITLIGHSMGGAIALQFALQYPGSIINKLILIGSGAKLKVAPAFFEAIETDFDRFLELLGRVAFHKNTSAQIKLTNEEVLRRNGGAIFLQDFIICDLFDIRSELHKITKRTLIIVGQDDQMTPIKYSTFLRENIKHSQLTIIPEAGHYVFQEKPLAVNNEIYKFISE